MKSLYNQIERKLQTLGYSYQKPAHLSKAILKASEHFIQEKDRSPWESKDFTAAYLAHFLPMNLVRICKGFQRLAQAQVDTRLTQSPIYDFGCGPLSLLIAYLLYYQKPPIEYNYFDIEPKVADLGKELLQGAFPGLDFNFLGQNIPLDKISKDHLLCLSYSLNELKQPEKEIFEFESLLIFEPSTQHQSRSLLEFRKKALSQGYNALAPCTHNLDCPLLTLSKKDWCFDRAFLNLPELTSELYKTLPFDQKQVSFSYLLLDRRKNKTFKSPNYGRLVGDELKEKGKSRMMICRDSRREFLALLKRQKLDFKLHLNIQRGDLYKIPEDIKTKSNELRLSHLAPKSKLR